MLSYLKPEEKAKRFLRDVMGQKAYDRFILEGKIEIRSGGCTYELTTDGTVINKTRNQRYCVILASGTPHRDEIPSYDILAIKYAWLKYRANTVEIVANKTNIRNPHDIEPGHGGLTTYDEFVRYMEERRWRREALTIHEHSSDNLATTNNIKAGETGPVIQIRAPAGGTITIMGIRQIPREPGSAHKLSVKLTDTHDSEIAPETEIEIVKESPMRTRTVAMLPYSHINPTRNNLYTTIQRKKSEYYSFDDGIWLGPNYDLKINAINPDKDIEDIKFCLDLDFWIR